MYLSKWGNAEFQDLKEVLLPDELTILNSNIDQLNLEIKQFKNKFFTKIENNRIKVEISDKKNYNK